MHESALARDLLNAVLDANVDNQTVKTVHGWISESEPLSSESLQLHFAIAAKGTSAESAVLQLALTHIDAKCFSCGKTYLPEHHLTICTHCGSTEGELLGKEGLGIDRIELT